MIRLYIYENQYNTSGLCAAPHGRLVQGPFSFLLKNIISDKIMLDINLARVIVLIEQLIIFIRRTCA